MAKDLFKALFSSLMLLIICLLAIIHLSEADLMPITTSDLTKFSESNAEITLPPNIDCGGACDARCELSSRPKLCKRACGTCCARCDCVPPGTSGNYDVCPCYANMTTHGGRHKCP